VDRQGWLGIGTNFAPPFPVANLPPNHSFNCIDDQTGAITLTIPNVWTMAGGDFAASPDGSLMTVILTGAAQTYDRFWVKTYSLASGALLSNQAVSSPGYTPRGTRHVPGTSIAYIGSNDRFHVYDGVAGAEIATIMLPGIVSASGPVSYAFNQPSSFTNQNMLYCVVGTSLITIDMTVHAIVNQTTLPFSQTIPLAIGPGSAGPALWATAWNPGMSGYQVIEIPLSSQTPVNATQVSAIPWYAYPSGGGTEMIFEFPAPSGGLMVLNASTHARVDIADVFAVSVLRSNTLTKAYALGSVPGYPSVVLKSIPTDPCTGSTSILMSAPGVYLLPLPGLLSN
jgi:hypothetical protein